MRSAPVGMTIEQFEAIYRAQQAPWRDPVTEAKISAATRFMDDKIKERQDVLMHEFASCVPGVEVRDALLSA